MKGWGIHTVSELLRLYPRRYDDLGNIIDIADAGAHRGGEKVTMYAKVCGVITEKRLSGGRLLTIVPVCDDSGATSISYFNNKFIKSSLKNGERYLFYGKIAVSGTPVIYNPEHYRRLPENGRLLPVYPLTSGISQSFMRKTALFGSGQNTFLQKHFRLKSFPITDLYPLISQSEKYIRRKAQATLQPRNTD